MDGAALERARSAGCAPGSAPSFRSAGDRGDRNRGFPYRIHVLRSHEGDPDAVLEEMEPHWMWRHRRLREGLPDDLFRFGVQFADGRKATNLNSPFGGLDPDEVPDDGPVLSERSGGGGGGSWEQGYWLWPLRPPASSAFSVSGPRMASPRRGSRSTGHRSSPPQIRRSSFGMHRHVAEAARTPTAPSARINVDRPQTRLKTVPS